MTLKKPLEVTIEAIAPAANKHWPILRKSPVKVPGVPAKSFIVSPQTESTFYPLLMGLKKKTQTKDELSQEPFFNHFWSKIKYTLAVLIKQLPITTTFQQETEELPHPPSRITLFNKKNTSTPN